MIFRVGGGQSPSGLADAQRVIGYFSFIIMIRQSRLSSLVARGQIVIGGKEECNSLDGYAVHNAYKRQQWQVTPKKVAEYYSIPLIGFASSFLRVPRRSTCMTILKVHTVLIFSGSAMLIYTEIIHAVTRSGAVTRRIESFAYH